MRNLQKIQKIKLLMARALLGLGLLGGVVADAGCGRPDNLVVVSVTGLETGITELHVTMTLDSVPAKNAQPSADDPDLNSFSVFQDMQRFGVEVPTGVQTLALSVSALNTSRVVVKSATGQLDLRQGKELSLALHLP